MSRLVRSLCIACTVGIGFSAWLLLRPAAVIAQVPDRDGGIALAARRAEDPMATALHDARRKCVPAAFDALVRELVARCDAEPDAPAGWHLLAKALLERCAARSHLLGIAPGRPIHSTLPPAVEQDVLQGLRAVDAARAAGDDSGDLFRIEAGLFGQRITGLASALLWNGKASAALRAAAERDPDDPRLHMALGMRSLFAPSWLGQDLDAAQRHFDYAAKAMPDDERPLVFAAMVEALQNRRQLAIERLEQAIARNPDNRFARVVVERLRRGEDDAFGRDITDEELARLR